METIELNMSKDMKEAIELAASILDMSVEEFIILSVEEALDEPVSLGEYMLEFPE